MHQVRERVCVSDHSPRICIRTNQAIVVMRSGKQVFGYDGLLTHTVHS